MKLAGCVYCLTSTAAQSTEVGSSMKIQDKQTGALQPLLFVIVKTLNGLKGKQCQYDLS